MKEYQLPHVEITASPLATFATFVIIPGGGVNEWDDEVVVCAHHLLLATIESA